MCNRGRGVPFIGYSHGAAQQYYIVRHAADRVRWLVEELCRTRGRCRATIIRKTGTHHRHAAARAGGGRRLSSLREQPQRHGIFAKLSGGGSTESSVLTALCGNKPHFALILLETHGWLILRPSPLRPCFDTFRVPLVRMPENKYYVVALAGVAAVDPATGARRPCRRAPRYAIIDSGSNMMSVSSHFLSELATAGVRAGGHHLSCWRSAHRRGRAGVHAGAVHHGIASDTR